MSHSKIFQISKKPIRKDEWAEPSEFYENSSDFADWIGDRMEDDDRKECIDSLAKELKQLFKHRKGSSVLIYKGGLDDFKKAWADSIHEQAKEVTADNLIRGLEVWRLEQLCTKTHLFSYYRMYIDDWNGYAGAMEDLISGINHEQFKPGTKIYVGAVIDYHC